MMIIVITRFHYHKYDFITIIITIITVIFISIITITNSFTVITLFFTITKTQYFCYCSSLTSPLFFSLLFFSHRPIHPLFSPTRRIKKEKKKSLSRRMCTMTGMWWLMIGKQVSDGWWEAKSLNMTDDRMLSCWWWLMVY